MKILFVDDEPHLLAGLRRLTHPLRSWSTRFANGGPEALRMLAEQPADVVVTDMRMPGMDGLEVLRAVGSAHPGTACVVLTGFAEAGREAEASNLADGWLSKPCTLESLIQVIERATQQGARTTDRTRASPSWSTER